ncbi:hypothetical protein B0T20DRAFT_411858 [Sordaria brevicollis]|uniref:Uncharacterized protein n=1 Tax=Sordaria brevicollis TaxID=83679 RepID=A0AAE0UC68_SORBR|nr:hypothetical protein B0T20DRAFT_411858 [Sordaria brevicollis]
MIHRCDAQLVSQPLEEPPHADNRWDRPVSATEGLSPQHPVTFQPLQSARPCMSLSPELSDMLETLKTMDDVINDLRSRFTEPVAIEKKKRKKRERSTAKSQASGSVPPAKKTQMTVTSLIQNIQQSSDEMPEDWKGRIDVWDGDGQLAWRSKEPSPPVITQVTPPVPDNGALDKELCALKRPDGQYYAGFSILASIVRASHQPDHISPRELVDAVCYAYKYHVRSTYPIRLVHSIISNARSINQKLSSMTVWLRGKQGLGKIDKRSLKSTSFRALDLPEAYDFVIEVMFNFANPNVDAALKKNHPN